MEAWPNKSQRREAVNTLVRPLDNNCLPLILGTGQAGNVWCNLATETSQLKILQREVEKATYIP
jgi:hypothetical protein